ncbi:Protein of unknown function [Gryllus bimaculatus]|nr:Protein of unknown function [Gryllus bimaculatus]
MLKFGAGGMIVINLKFVYMNRAIYNKFLG